MPNEIDTTPANYFDNLAKWPKVYSPLRAPANPGPPHCTMCNDYGRRDWYKIDPKTGLEANDGSDQCECSIKREIERKMRVILADAPRGQAPSRSPLFERDSGGRIISPLSRHQPGLILRGDWDTIASHLWVLFEDSMRRIGTQAVTIRSLTDYEAFNIRMSLHSAQNMSKAEKESGAYINTIQDFVGVDHRLVLLRCGFYTTNNFSGAVLNDVISTRIAIRKSLWIIERADRPLVDTYGSGILDQLRSQGFRIVTFESQSEKGIALDDDLPAPPVRTMPRRQPEAPRPSPAPTLNLDIVEPSDRRRGRGRGR